MSVKKITILCSCGLALLVPLRGQTPFKEYVADPIPSSQIQNHVTSHYDVSAARRLNNLLGELQNSGDFLQRRAAAKLLIEPPVDQELMYKLLVNDSSRQPLANAICDAASIQSSVLQPIIRAMLYHAPKKGESPPLRGGGATDPYSIVGSLKRILDKVLGVDTPEIPVNAHGDYKTEDLVAWWQTITPQILADPKVSQQVKSALPTVSATGAVN